MTELDILKYLQEKDIGNHYVDLLPLFSKNLSDTKESYERLIFLLKILEEKKFIHRGKYAYGYKNLGEQISIPGFPPRLTQLTFEELRNRAISDPITYQIAFKISLDGRKEIADIEFKEQLREVNKYSIKASKSAIGTNTTMRISTIVIAAATIVSAIAAFKSCTNLPSSNVQEKQLLHRHE